MCVFLAVFKDTFGNLSISIQDGERFARRGYWGDILNSPYISFGIESEETSLFKKSNDLYVKVRYSTLRHPTQFYSILLNSSQFYSILLNSTVFCHFLLCPSLFFYSLLCSSFLYYSLLSYALFCLTTFNATIYYNYIELDRILLYLICCNLILSNLMIGLFRYLIQSNLVQSNPI